MDEQVAGRHAVAPTFAACDAGTTVAGACEGLMDDLRVLYPLPSVYLLVDGRLRCQAARGYFQVIDGFPPDTGVIGRVIASGRPVLIADVALEPEFIAAKPGLLSEVCVPILLGGQVVGAVNVESTEELSPETVAVLTGAAGALAARIESLGGLPPVALSQRLARIAVGLAALVDPAEIDPRVVQGAIEISGMDSAALCRPGPDGAWGVSWADGPLTDAVTRWTTEEYRLVAGSVQAGTSLHVIADPSDPPAGYGFLLRGGIRAVMVHPLVVGGDVTGLLITADTVSRPHDAVRGAAVELLAAQAAASLGMAAALQELGQRARYDALTGLRNASTFADDLLDATRAGRSAPAATACVFIDVDRFKQVNDTLGHLAGDRLLRALADELVLSLADRDALYRIGGDEFAALLHGATAADACVVGDRLVHAAHRAGTTVSVGTAMIDRGMTLEHIRTAADRALYRAKAAGRDRALTAPRQPVPSGGSTTVGAGLGARR